LQIYFKIKVMGGVCNEFFGGEWYWCTLTKFKTIQKFTNF
jgi:hypothetical protein